MLSCSRPFDVSDRSLPSLHDQGLIANLAGPGEKGTIGNVFWQEYSQYFF